RASRLDTGESAPGRIQIDRPTEGGDEPSPDGGYLRMIPQTTPILNGAVGFRQGGPSTCQIDGGPRDRGGRGGRCGIKLGGWRASMRRADKSIKVRQGISPAQDRSDCRTEDRHEPGEEDEQGHLPAEGADPLELRVKRGGQGGRLAVREEGHPA